MRRTLAGLLIAAACAASPIAAQSQRARAAADPVAAAPSTTFDVVDTSIADLQSAMTAGRVTSHELVSLYLARIRAYDHDGPRLNTMIALNPRALETADALDRERAGRTCADRCTASRSSSRTTTKRPTCRRPADRWRSQGFRTEARCVTGRAGCATPAP